jgi:hypothetical protein
VHTYFVIIRMNSCFHGTLTSVQIIRFYRNSPGFSKP